MNTKHFSHVIIATITFFASMYAMYTAAKYTIYSETRIPRMVTFKEEEFDSDMCNEVSREMAANIVIMATNMSSEVAHETVEWSQSLFRLNSILLLLTLILSSYSLFLTYDNKSN